MCVDFLLNLFQTNIMTSLEMRSEWENVITNETVFQEVTVLDYPENYNSKVLRNIGKCQTALCYVFGNGNRQGHGRPNL